MTLFSLHHYNKTEVISQWHENKKVAQSVKRQKLDEKLLKPAKKHQKLGENLLKLGESLLKLEKKHQKLDGALKKGRGNTLSFSFLSLNTKK